MNHEESRLLQQCVAWFRAQYPQYAMLLTHPANEGNGNRVSGAIHKAEGTVAGVPDLILFMPSDYKMRLFEVDFVKTYTGLGIEMKTKTGKQTQQQKDFQKMFEAAGYKYIIVRSFEEFKSAIDEYISNIEVHVMVGVAYSHVEIVHAAEKREKEKFYKIIGKKQ